ncbi:hypothetical protein MKSMC1_49230 [Mycobacterium kansasii]|uniref:Uncharacterized protein n=1 Tax=Mycobacterium kansasii TaxID=1768 RepID=A0A1V3XPA5_MYCKA|nr:hypothetical protein MKSMC1_49230 [Mycobacterium kansasii]OOK80928.1 hypothetical protein BZL29_2350 [Mycobacterium kansasii]
MTGRGPGPRRSCAEYAAGVGWVVAASSVRLGLSGVRLRCRVCSEGG